MNIKRNFKGDILILIAVALVVYWPLSFSVYSLKNDALTYFLPFRYQVSECIRNGSFPWWSLNIYTGLPLHSDIQSGVWNPVVMFISLFTTYNMTVLQWETLFYIIIGGIGFYKLCSHFTNERSIKTVMAISYMCSGFIIDSASFIPWITSAAYIPFVFNYFLALVNFPRIDNSIKLSLSTALLFLSGYLSYFIFTAYLLLIILVVLIVYRLKNGQSNKHIIKFLALSVPITVFICGPALLSYIEFFPYYERGQGTSLKEAQTNPFTFSNTISYILPPASYKLNTGNDISSRNAYIGLIPILFMLYAFKGSISKRVWLVTALTVFSLLFSLGDALPVRALAYHLPFMDSFRHPATVRLFTNMGVLVISMYGLYKFFQHNNKSFKRLVLIISILVMGSVIYGLTQLQNTSSLFFELSNTGIKKFLNETEFNGWLILAGIMQLPFLIFFYFYHKKINLVAFTVANVIIMSLLSMPFTMVSQQPVKQVNNFVKGFQKGFHKEIAMETVKDHVNDSSMVTISGYIPFYEKRISIQDHVITPTLNSDYGIFLKNDSLRKYVSQHSMAWIENGNATILQFKPGILKIRTTSNSASVLHVTQQYHHNWKASIDGKRAEISKDNIAFMKLEVPAGMHHIQLSYRSGIIKVAGIFSVVILLSCLILLVYFKRK